MSQTESMSLVVRRSVIALAMAMVPHVAQADSSCDALFGSLRAKLQENSNNYALAMWTTNYFAPERDDRFMAKTELVMRLQNGDLFGAQKRDRIGFSKNDVAKSSTDESSVRIRADGMMMFNEQYGPYDPKCWGDKFAVVDCDDCMEVFSFRVGNDLARYIDAGDQMTIVQSPTPVPLSASAVPDGTRQWNVADADTVHGNENYGLFNLRRRVLSLSDQLGYVKQDDSWGAAVADTTLRFGAGASGGYFVFVRRNPDDRGEVSEDEVFAIYNTKAKKYVGTTPIDWSKTPIYEWKILGRNGADFALFNVNVEDYLVISETSWRTHERLTYFHCSQNHDARMCANNYPR